jgi:hypothetical protein
MKTTAGPARNGAALLLAMTMTFALAACADAPDLARLAPTMPKLTAEVPDSTHPEAANSPFPNINETPDRESVLHSKGDLEQIEKSLEMEGDEHVKQAVSKITGKPPEPEKKEKDADKKKQVKTAPKPDTKDANQPLQLSPPPSDKPS